MPLIQTHWFMWLLATSQKRQGSAALPKHTRRDLAGCHGFHMQLSALSLQVLPSLHFTGDEVQKEPSLTVPRHCACLQLLVSQQTLYGNQLFSPCIPLLHFCSVSFKVQSFRLDFSQLKNGDNDNFRELCFSQKSNVWSILRSSSGNTHRK